MKFTEENQRNTQKITPSKIPEIEVNTSTLTVLTIVTLFILLLLI